jgi:hypothetical protein
MAEILWSAVARIDQTDFDNWNGGTAYYTLFLEVPVQRYGLIEPDLEKAEEAVAAKVRRAIRLLGNQQLSSVVITPVLEGAMTRIASSDVHDRDATHLWEPNQFRLFLSHVSAHRVDVTGLKRELSDLGISSFVAHQDIEPSSEWREEIAVAIRSMHAMAALLTTDFHASNWTDQEVGMAVARGALVIPVRLGQMPYGFMAKYQALPGDLTRRKELAAAIGIVLARSPSTRSLMAEALVAALENADSYSGAKAAAAVIDKAPALDEAQLLRMEAAVIKNPQVGDSFGVPAAVKRIVAHHREGVDR